MTADTLSTVMESQLELESVKNRNNSTPSPTSTALDSHGSSGSGKWNCVACTYENWPKAKCCVICGVLKGASETAVAIHDYQTTLSSSITQTSSNPSNSTQAQQQTQYSNTNRVVGSSSGGSHRNNERDSHGGENTENNCDYERRLRQVRIFTHFPMTKSLKTQKSNRDSYFLQLLKENQKIIILDISAKQCGNY